MKVYKWYRTVLTLCFIGFFSLFLPVLIIAAGRTPGDAELNEISQSQFTICPLPPAYTFKSYKGHFLGVELDIPDIWRPEEENDKGRIKFVGSSEDCVDAGLLDYKSIRGFLPGVPYTVDEGKKFFGQQWMKPQELINNIKVIKTSQGYSATYSTDDFIGIAGVKLPEHTKPLVLIIFAQREGKHIEQRMVHMLNTLKYIGP